MGVCKYLDLSTSHLSAMGRLFLANPEKFEKQGEVVVCPKSYGWIILYWVTFFRRHIPVLWYNSPIHQSINRKEWLLQFICWMRCLASTWVS